MEEQIKIIEHLNRIMELQEKQVKIFKIMDDTDNKLFNIILSLEKIITLLAFFIFLLIWRVFLRNYTNHLLTVKINGWNSLIEGYKTLALTSIGVILSGIITEVLSYLVIEKIKKYFKK